MGKRLAEYLRETGAPLLTTYFAGAILAELHGASRLHCLVTDSDVNRVWAPPEPSKSRIVYFAPAERVRRRLQSYGVPEERIRVTGYPLPDELVGAEWAALRRNLAARLSRLRVSGELRKAAEAELGPLPAASEPPLVVFAVGGAGAQVPLARKLVRGLAEKIKKNFFRLALVAGRRHEVGEALRDALYREGLDGLVEVLEDPDVFGYFRRFNALLANADALWSKPSEMTFFAALGLPFISAPPVGVHEAWNVRWAADRGAALPQHDPAAAGDWLQEWLEDGVLASAAWAGYTRLPSGGLYRIAEELAQSGSKPRYHCRRWTSRTSTTRCRPELIAQAPLAERDASRLLVLAPRRRLRTRHVRDLPELLPPGDLLVVNDARVIPARLRGRKAGPAAASSCCWSSPSAARTGWLLRPGVQADPPGRRCCSTVERAPAV